MRELNFAEISSVNGGVLFIPKLIILGISAYGAGYGMGKHDKSKKESNEPEVNNGSCYPTC
jgi:lactobin A/cerein 7B family class IIb bacteriocin